MATTRRLNPDNAKANAGVKSRPARNRRAGAGAAAYSGVKITSAPEKEQKRRLKESAGPAIPLAAVGAGAMYYLIKNSKK